MKQRLKRVNDLVNQLISWSEKKIRTDMNYLIKGSFWLLLGQGLSFAASAILVWLFANFLPKEVYGQYRFMTAAIAVLALTALPGMDTTLTRAVARSARATIYTAVRAKISWGLLGTGAALSVSFYYGLQGNTELAVLFVMAACFIPWYETFATYNHYLQGLKDFRRTALYRSIQRSAVVLSVGLAVVSTSNIYVIFMSLLLTSVVADLVFFRLSLKVYPPLPPTDDDSVAYGKKLSFVTAVRISAQHLDKLVLWYVAGPIQVATYSIAAAIPQELSSTVSHINRLALPKMSARDKHELRQALLRKITIYFIALLPIVAAYITLSPFLFQLFFPQYLEAVPYTQLLSLIILAAPAGLLVQYFHSTKNISAIAAMNTIEPVMLVGLYALLIPFFGIYGVIYAILARSFGSFLVLFLFFKKE